MGEMQRQGSTVDPYSSGPSLVAAARFLPSAGSPGNHPAAMIVAAPQSARMAGVKKWFLLLISYVVVAALGFAAGIYVLPILIAPAPPTAEDMRALAQSAIYSGTFRRDLADSDRFHWGEGEVFVGPEVIYLDGSLAPGPDYKLYLSRQFVETEAEFNRLKPTMVRVGDVRTFENFIVPVPAAVSVDEYVAVIVWCETFGQFITAARYQ